MISINQLTLTYYKKTKSPIFSNAVNRILNNHVLFLSHFNKIGTREEIHDFLGFVGFELILKPETPAFVKKGQTLELTCQSKEPEGLFGYYMIDVEMRKTLLSIGGGGFKTCEAYTNQTIFECHFEKIWTFKLTLLNPIHNQTIECIRAYNRTSSSINTTIFVQGNTWVIATNRNYYSKHFHFT